MKTRFNFMLPVMAIICFAILLLPGSIFAHCDTLDGPVIQDAKMALEKGDVTPVLKWVKKENEPEIISAFNAALAEKNSSPDVKEKTEMKLFETLVRVHRAGEGAPFTGLKPSGAIEPIVAEADKAIEAGSVDSLTSAMSGHLLSEVKKRFDRVIEKKKHMDESVEAGREYVEAYVDYVHYVEGAHKAIAGEGGHHEETEEAMHEIH